MEGRLPLLADEGPNDGAGCMSCFKRKLGGICSALTTVNEFIQFGPVNKLVLEPLPPHLQIGNTVEMIEDDGHTFVEATVQDISISDGMILVNSNCDGSQDNFILLQKDKVRPVQPSSVNTEHHGKGAHPNFLIYDSVDVLINGKWMAGVIVHSPSNNEDSYHVQIFRQNEKVDMTIKVTTKIRLHLDWDGVSGWNYHANEANLHHPLNQAVGLVGKNRAKIVKMLDAYHAVVEFNDLTNSDGTHVQEVIHMKNWYKSRWARGLKKLRNWLAPSTDPLSEFECYMPVYTCFAILASVSSVFFSNSAENWPDNMLLLFYLLGGLCCSLSVLLALGLGVMCRQPTTRTALRVWRVLCFICVAVGATFLTIHTIYGRQALVASRAKKASNVLSV